MSAENASRWHAQQRVRAQMFIPQKPELPGDYVGGGVISGRSQTPQLPAGTEKFISNTQYGSQFPREWWAAMSVAVMMFVLCVIRKK